MHDVSVILVSYNTVHLLPECLASLRAASAGLNVQTLVVDNASRDGSVAWLQAHHPEIELIVNEHNVGFGRANNQAAARVRAPWVLLLNTDAFIAPDALHNTLAYLREHGDVGIVGGRLVGRDGVLQPSCRYFPTLTNLFIARSGLWRWFRRARMIDDLSWDHAAARECDWVPGCYYMLRREVLDRVGLFDARYFLYMEEVDHCRATKRAGWKVAFLPSARVVHIGGESAKSDAALSAARQVPALQIESELLYFRKWLGLPGVALHLMLSLLAIGVSSVRNLLRGRASAWFRAQGADALTWLRLAGQTRLGAQGTR